MQKLDKQQTALLFHLMFFEEIIPILSKFKPRVKKTQALQLEDMKLIKMERASKTSPFKNVSLTDYAWEWMPAHFAYPAQKPGAADYALERLFSKICRLQKNDGLFFAKLVELLAEKSPRSAEGIIISAYLKASGGNFCELVAVSDVRKNLPPDMRDGLNDALVAMMRAKKLQLNVQGHPALLKEEDRLNPVLVGGQPHHVVYIGGA